MKPTIQGADGVITMGVLATLANIYGAVTHNRTITIPVIGGFVVTTILLAVSRPAPRLAELFAGAYFITSLLTNGAPAIEMVNKLIGEEAQVIKPSNSTVSQTGTAVPGITLPINNPGAGHNNPRPV